MPWRALAGGLALAVTLQVAQAGQQQPRVVLVQPSATDVPANLLRLSIVFATPIEGAVLPRIALTHADGSAVQEPFLQQELWSPDGKVLTLLLHPGRVKTGLIAREQWGPIVRAGDEVILTVDGLPIKQWHVGPADADGPNPSAWKLSTVHPASRQPFVVTLDAPIDGRDADCLAIADAKDRRIDGHARLDDGERTWTFTPVAPWRAGEYRLVAHGTLEDPAGNRLSSHFETSIESPLGPATDESVLFTVGSTPDVSSGRAQLSTSMQEGNEAFLKTW